MDYAEFRYSISTHDLTRRSTQHSRRQAHQNWYFNSRPHEEVDSRQIANPHIIIDFNSRPHEKVDMLPESVSLSGEAFQLTTSRGGRRQVVVVVILPLIFQLTTSRGGRPVVGTAAMTSSDISTHDLTRRSTFSSVRITGSPFNFNSRPHEEVDRYCTRLK